MSYRMILGVLVLFYSLAPANGAAEIVTTSAERQAVSLTIYNTDLALIRDSRRIKLPKGKQTLAFKEISSQIQPETALLKGDQVEVLEQNYEFDLLTPEALLSKYVGRDITLVRRDMEDEPEYKVKAKVLSVASGIVLRIDDHIETELAGRIIYPDVPENLREKPTLTMTVRGTGEQEKNLELSYLSGGLSWKADYIAELNEAEDRLDLKGWVTLVNNSGADYRDAKLQLVAGDVHRAPTRSDMLPMMDVMRESKALGAPQNMARESLFEYHLYSVGRPTTLLQNQSKQITLLQENNGLCTKELVLRPENPSYYWAKVGQIAEREGVDVYLRLKNDKASNFGLPKPAGTVRVYKKDASGFSQFIGEDNIDHTPENEIIKIKLGKAFDVTAERVQTDFSIARGSSANQRIYESAYKITLKNAKEEAVEVRVEEMIPGDWQILSETADHKKLDAATVSWNIKIKPKASSTLEYKVRQVMN